MAIRNILKLGEDNGILTKKCRKVEKIDNRILALLDDMAETLHEANGVGLAAPQVGVLRRLVIVDVGDGVIELINPEIIHTEGEQTDYEGCLSYPGKYGEVKRPYKVIVRAQDRDGNWREITGEGLMGRAFCHETDHLDGQMFLNLVTKWAEPDESEE